MEAKRAGDGRPVVPPGVVEFTLLALKLLVLISPAVPLMRRDDPQMSSGVGARLSCFHCLSCAPEHACTMHSATVFSASTIAALARRTLRRVVVHHGLQRTLRTLQMQCTHACGHWKNDASHWRSRRARSPSSPLSVPASEAQRICVYRRGDRQLEMQCLQYVLRVSGRRKTLSCSRDRARSPRQMWTRGALVRLARGTRGPGATTHLNYSNSLRSTLLLVEKLTLCQAYVV